MMTNVVLERTYELFGTREAAAEALLPIVESLQASGRISKALSVTVCTVRSALGNHVTARSTRSVLLKELYHYLKNMNQKVSSSAV
jgi:hypothetical protein